MAISDVFERLGRAVFESPFGANRLAKDAPELAEIRLAALDAIKAKSHRVSGKNVFPFDLVRIQLLGVPEEQEAIFHGEFLSKYFGQELKDALARSSYRFPSNLAVEFGTTSRLPAEGEPWLSVQTITRQPAAISSDSRTPVNAILTVLNGTANHAELRLEKMRTNIGRTVEVFRGSGPSRRNDLAFLGDGEAEKTVSREHAHILRSQKTGEYRLFNDRVYRGDENCGLWLVRDGLSYPVHRGSRGTLLRSGDEVHLGTAVLLFSFDQ